MQIINNGIAIVSAILWLAACSPDHSKEQAADSRLPLAAAVIKEDQSKAKAEDEAKASEQARLEVEARTETAARLAAPMLAPPLAPESAASARALPRETDTGMGRRIEAYFDSLKTAAYTFNPPSPIRIAEPVTVHLWVDPQATTAALAEELKKFVPQDAARVEAGETKWSPVMRATLSGPDFVVKAIDPEEQPVIATLRTTWSWDITPTQPGKNRALHLRLEVVLPPDLGPPKTITTLDRTVNVEVTWWWLFDFYFDKYWKWLLGGLGTVIVSVIAWWWKNKHASEKSKDEPA